MSLSHRIRIRQVETLSADWYVLKKTTFDWQRSDGTWQTVSRETYDFGNGVALLPYNLKRRTVLLVRQFRYPAYVNGHDDLLIETAAGLLDDASPEERVRSEVEEELGLKLGDIRRVFTCFTSPGSVTEKLHLFVAEYDREMQTDEGGGLKQEGEDIEALELDFNQAMKMIETGAIQDAKTILLLQHAALNIFDRSKTSVE